MARLLYEIARDCQLDMQAQARASKTRGMHSRWQNKFYAAVPYLEAMFDLHGVEQNYGQDSGKSIVRYFLANVSTWKGEKARELKAELKELLGDR
jgi:hypothetical protein